MSLVYLWDLRSKNQRDRNDWFSPQKPVLEFCLHTQSKLWGLQIYHLLFRSLSLKWCYFCVLKKWVHSKIGQYGRPAGRPAVYTITPEKLIRSSWNFYHSFISSISRSSSKMSRIGPEFTGFQQRVSWFSIAYQMRQILTSCRVNKNYTIR